MKDIEDIAKENGFNVEYTNGILYLLLDANVYFSSQGFLKANRKFRDFLKEEKYSGSYGCRPVGEENTGNHG